MTETPVRVGFESHRTTYTKEQIESLSEIKKLNGGNIYATVSIAKSEPMFQNMQVMELVKFAEDCDRMLQSWEADREHSYEFIRPA